MYRGDWAGTILPIQVSVIRGVVTMPRIVGEVRKINITKKYVPVYNGWYNFLPFHWSGGNCCGPWLDWLDLRNPWLGEYGRACTFAQPPTSTCVLQIQGIADDVGAILQFFGTDPTGNPLRTDNGDGTWSDGITLTLNLPFTVGTDLVGNVVRAIKPRTQGQVSVSALDTLTGTSTPLAVYDASETNPSYAQYTLHAQACTPPPTWTAIALVKLKFVPVVADTDPVLIPNLHALKLFIQGVRFGEAGDRANSLAYQADAVKELNLQDWDITKDDQIPISINPFGSAEPWKAMIGPMK